MGKKKQDRCTSLCLPVVLCVTVAGLLMWLAAGPSRSADDTGQQIQHPHSGDTSLYTLQGLERGSSKTMSPIAYVSLETILCAAPIVDPDIRRLPVSSFLQDYKNPCWRSESLLQCLPYFHVAGSFNSGSWNLFTRISKHPQFVPSSNAQPHFWAEHAKTWDGYLDTYASGVAAVSAAPSTAVMGDGSASTFAFYYSAGQKAHRAWLDVFRPCWIECAEGANSEDSRIACLKTKCYPSANSADLDTATAAGLSFRDMTLPLLMRGAYHPAQPFVIAMLRNPIDRLHSGFWTYDHYQGKYGKTPEGFLAYVTEQVTAFKACAAKPEYTADECQLLFESLGRDEEAVFYHADQIFRSMYPAYLKHWLGVFDKDHVIVLKSEDYFQNPRRTLSRLFEDMALEQPSESEWVAILAAGDQAKTSAAAEHRMLPEARALLLDFFAPYNVELAELLDDPAYLAWNQPL